MRVFYLKGISMKTIKTFLFITLFTSSIFSQIDNDKIDSIIKSSLTENKGYNWLKELCNIGPRLSGSENSLKAIKWAETKMKSIGFDSVWLQKVFVPHWERGKIEKAFVSNSKKYLNKYFKVTALGGSVATPINGITGKIIEVKSVEEVAKLNNAKGKIIFYNRPFDNSLVNTMEAYGKAVDQRSIGAIEAAKVGAIGVIVRSIQSNYDNNPHTGAMRYDETINKIPAVAISVIDADFLSKAIKEDENLEVTLILDCKKFDDALSYNVIGEIKGSEFPNEIIVAGGHFDSWDKGCGAHDDGGGCIQSIEAVELFKRLNIKPKRTLRTVLFINEENGLKGGIEYSKLAQSLTEEHLAAIESDRGVHSPRGFYVTTDSITFNKLQNFLPYLNKTKIDWIKFGGSGADVGQLKNAKALFGYVPDDQRYMDYHHSENDTFDKVNPREMELGTASISILMYLLSENGL